MPGFPSSTFTTNIYTVISSCAAKPPVSPSAASATNATANAPSVTRTCDQRRKYASATSAVLATTRTNAWYAAGMGFPTRSTVSNAHGWRKIATDVQRSSIWAVRERICFTKRKGFAINEVEGFGRLWYRIRQIDDRRDYR
nr:hypothetical protein CFP56_24571 [Quercus suber]